MPCGGGAETGGLRSPGRAVSGAGVPDRVVRRARSGGSPGLLPGSLPPAPRVGRLLRGSVEILDLVLPDPGQLLPRPETPRAGMAAAARLARAAWRGARRAGSRRAGTRAICGPRGRPGRGATHEPGVGAGGGAVAPAA